MKNKSSFDVQDIIKIIPHRYPFLLVDKILEYDLEKGCVLGIKNVTINEHFFQGHFPESPIMPGVLILEALAQTGCVLLNLKVDCEKTALLLNISNAKFRNPVRPGDVLYMHCELLHLSSKGGRLKASALINNETVALQAEFGFVLADVKKF